LLELELENLKQENLKMKEINRALLNQVRQQSQEQGKTGLSTIFDEFS